MHQPSKADMTVNRIAYLDGMRCLAILAVMGFHYFTGWVSPSFRDQPYPYGDLLSEPFKFGYLGVQFFFMISGFVITMTLERCAHWRVFAVRRIARLLPAMMIYSLLTYTCVSFFAPNIFQVSSWGFVPSWLFTRPEFLNQIFATTIFNSIDSAYWSLYVEVKFYLVIGGLYFLSKKHFYLNALLFFTFTFLVSDIAHAMEWQGLYESVGYVLYPQHFPWFVIGIGFYFLWQGKPLKYYGSFIAIGVMQLLIVTAQEPAAVKYVSAFALPLIFYAVMRLERLRRLLSWRPLAAVGMASYGLYLVHQNVGVLLIGAISASFGLSGWASVPIALVVALMLIGLSVTVFRYVEYPINRYAVARAEQGRA